MVVEKDAIQRLQFLVQVAEKELKHLRYSQNHVFRIDFTLEQAQKLEEDPAWAETVEAFSSRFCRFQDTLGDKLLPHYLKMLGEPVGAVIDYLDKAEKLGLVNSADDWFASRQLRNQMVHEYFEDIQIFVQALQTANQRITTIQNLLQNIKKDAQKRGWL